MHLTKTIYFMDCECGSRIEVRSGQAGHEVTCENCRRTIQAGSLARLKKLNTKTKADYQAKKRFRFSIRDLFVSMIVVSVLSALPIQIGVPVVVVFLSGSLFLLFVSCVALLVHHQEAIRGKFWDFVQRK